jgi:hypothetical protein
MMTCGYTFIQSDKRNIAIASGVANSIINKAEHEYKNIAPPPPIIEFATPLAIAHVSKFFLNFHFYKIFHYFIICEIFSTVHFNSSDLYFIRNSCIDG